MPALYVIRTMHYEAFVAAHASTVRDQYTVPPGQSADVIHARAQVSYPGGLAINAAAAWIWDNTNSVFLAIANTNAIADTITDYITIPYECLSGTQIRILTINGSASSCLFRLDVTIKEWL